MWKVFIALLVLASCTTQRKAEDFFNKNQREAAAYCAATFPDQESVVVRENIEIDTQYFETPDSGWVFDGSGASNSRVGFHLDKNGNLIPLDDLVRAEPIRGGRPEGFDEWNFGDAGNGGFSFKCPPSKIITRTITRDTTKTKVDGALVASLRFQVGDEVKKREALVAAHQKEILKKDAKIKQLEAENQKLKGKVKELNWRFYIMVGIIIGYLLFKFRLWNPFFKSIGKLGEMFGNPK